MQIAKRIKYGENIPRGYGVAIHDFLRSYAVCYPIPFHWIVRVVDRLWWKFKNPSPADVEARLIEMYNRGFQEGRHIGYTDAMKYIDDRIKSVLNRETRK